MTMQSSSESRIAWDSQAALRQPARPKKAKPFKSYRNVFWSVVITYIAYALLNIDVASVHALIGGVLVAILAFVPVYLWCIGKLPGLPIFPAAALAYSWTFALPLITNQRQIALYEASAKLEAALTAALFLLVGTVVYSLVVRLAYQPPVKYLAIPRTYPNAVYLMSIILCSVYQMALTAQVFNIPRDFIGVANAAYLTASTFSVFILAHRWGQGGLGKPVKVVFVAAYLALTMATLTSLYLVGAMTIIAITIGAYTIGRSKLPVVLTVLCVALLGFLHIGKANMRLIYWRVSHEGITIFDYPTFYLNWADSGLSAVSAIFRPEAEEEGSSMGLHERVSLAQMTLLVQSQSPEPVPFLMGQTYTIIPRLLLPRFVNPDKATTHEGTYILSIAYGLQTREESTTTTIAFGFLAEAYANFGFVGVVGLGFVIGASFGIAARWGRGVPLTSLRGLASLLVLFAAIQNEHTAAVSIATLVQTFAILLLFAVLLMKPERRVPTRNVPWLDREPAA